MSNTENTAVTPETTEPTPDVVTGMHWTSEAERDEFLAEAERRKAAGESLEGMSMPIVITPGAGE